MHPLALLLLLVGTLVFVVWLNKAPPAVRSKALWLTGVAVLVLLAATGRLNWLFAAIGAGLVLLQRVLTATQLIDRLKSIRGATPGKTSGVETEYLNVSLDHATGEVSGRVIDGEFKGRALETLSLTELIALHRECSGKDPQSLSVLEAYMDRRFGESWREGREQVGGLATPSSPAMSREEAIEILGIDESASETEIVEAHRRLMQKIHPDRGGSTYLAAKINQARDVLIGM